jgi:WD40 repeat protein
MYRLTLLIITYLSYRAISSCVLLSLISQNFVSKYLHGKLIGAPDNEDESEDSTTECNKSTFIYCATEEGDLALINWKTAIMNPEDQVISKSAKEGSMRTLMEKNRQPEELLPDAIQWSIQDHFGRIVSLEHSPFFPQILLSVSCWGFHVWNVQNHFRKKPVFISSHPSTIYTVGRWSPSRPGLILLAKVDGSIDVWDFMNSFYVPTKTQLVTQSHITSMEIWQDQQSPSTLVVVGDCSGSLTLLDIPIILSRPQPNEQEEMAKFFQLKL